MPPKDLSDVPGSPERLSRNSLTLPENPPTEVIDQASEVLRPYIPNPEKARQAAAQIVAVAEMHIGPLPHPKTFEGYNLVLPGSAQEILNMAVAEQRHRHKMESLENHYPFYGLTLGAFALLLCVGGSIYLGMHDKPIIASALLGAPLLTAVGWFINARLKRSDEKRSITQTPARPKSTKRR